MTLMRLLTPSRMLVFKGKMAEARMPRRYFRSRFAKAIAGAMPLSIARRYQSFHLRAPSLTDGANQISLMAVFSR